MPFSYGNYRYSLDKIKLKGKLKKQNQVHFPHCEKIRTWCEYRLPSWCECISASEEDLRAFRYRFSYVLRVKGEKEGVFFICEWYNGDFKEQREKPDAFLIEFNPNKSGEWIYQNFCQNFIFSFTDIVSCDLAYDIPGADIADVLIDTKCDVMTYGKVFNSTYYVAPKEDGSGRVKVYQKDTERKLNGNEMEKTLRIEVSLKGSFLSYGTIHLTNAKTAEQLTKAVEHLNAVKIKTSAASTDDWKVFALSCLSPEDLQKCLGFMASAQKSKYRKLIMQSSYYSLGLDIPTFAIHIGNLLTPYVRRIKVK